MAQHPFAKRTGLVNVTKWILKLNPKGQATIPADVRRALGVGGEIQEFELVLESDGFRLRAHKPPLPIRKYIGYCAEELLDIENPVTFVRELRGRDASKNEEQ
ncbi:MAG: hypothetical protein DDT21_02319 [Syntrophomonadaceae bacterium]|nr:hypothetical protein [Bacillota bacterium]